MTAVLLDSEPLSLLARPRRGAALDRLRGTLAEASRRRIPVRVPTAVLAELYRGTRNDAAIDTALSRFGVRPLTVGVKVARHAGAILHRHGLDSCHLVDAVLVASAVRLGGGLIVTGDGGDIATLASRDANVRIQSL